jgi:hypothetical protein
MQKKKHSMNVEAEDLTETVVWRVKSSLITPPDNTLHLEKVIWIKRGMVVADKSGEKVKSVFCIINARE